MNRRSFLASVAIAGGSLVLRRSVWGQEQPPATQTSSLEKSEAIRMAALKFLQTLSPDRRDGVTFGFPLHETPTAIGFGGMGGGPGGHGGPTSGPSDRRFDRGPDNGHGPDGGPYGGMGGGPGGGPGGGQSRPAAGEKYGQAVWTNFPVNIVHRPGLRMGQLTAAERDAAHGLLKVVLSPMGYQKVLDIMAADQNVADGGVDYDAGLDTYTLALFGQPNATAPWMFEFGGHHLGLNVTFVGDKAVCAPLHTGILPAKFNSNGKIIRGLGRENDKAFDLLATLSPQQLKSALIDHDVSDLLCGPGRPTVNFPQQGMRGADMTDSQREMMFELSREWVGILNDIHSAPRLEAIRKSLSETYFAWSGPLKHKAGENGESYFRIHGPSLLVEHAPQSNQGGYKLHVHTVMRDLNNDYAKQLV